MPSILTMRPLSPTAGGRAAVQAERFRTLCAQVAITTKCQELPYETLEGRMRYLAATTLCPKLANRTEDDFISFCRAHWDEIERAWRTAAEPTMKRIDTDFTGLMRDFGFNLPQPQ